jgi:hypothetical protein
MPLDIVCYQQGICKWDREESLDDECPSVTESYWTIKQAANKLAEKTLEELTG